MKEHGVLYGHTEHSRVDEVAVKAWAKRMHEVGLGCHMGDWADMESGDFGHGCIADHEAQARLMLYGLVDA